MKKHRLSRLGYWKRGGERGGEAGGEGGGGRVVRVVDKGGLKEARRVVADKKSVREKEERSRDPVSYTHLTLPTNHRV